MIHYEAEVSSFFEANENYIEPIEQKLKAMKLECSGYCNVYGYELEADIIKNHLTYHIKLHKHQSTQNGVIIPVDSLNYAGIELIVKGLNNKIKVSIGRSIIKRLFTISNIKKLIPSPYFMNFNYTPENDFNIALAKKIINNKIAKLNLNGGILLCKIHTDTIDPFDLIADMDTIIKYWK